MSFLSTMQSVMTGLAGLYSSDGGSYWDAEQGTQDRLVQEEDNQTLAGENRVVIGDGIDEIGQSTDQGGGRVGGGTAMGVDAPVTAFLPSTTAPSPASAGTAPVATDARMQEDSTFRMRVSWDGLGLSVPLTRDGKWVLLGLAVAAVLIGCIALGITIVNNRKV
ncbi:hypothetical protein K488DRAFT_68992 [Vararia minispora EC-137]|uniref:Uncharacterized protein n=1 Tax=Vararia minispora EC-137 TaxID=1314806 RepID=A0ACB8QRZ3_9AGAM|nr:hypothetical protein K488DRAFT_68992 [Vararia minispora EC-137]